MFKSKILIVADSFKDFSWLVDEYSKRIWDKNLNITLIKPEKAWSKEQIVRKETSKIIKTLEKDNNYKILLTLNGECKTTEELKKVFSKKLKLTFIIGWAYWLNEKNLEKYIDLKLSLWKHTKSHLLVLVEILEQIYRIQDILKWWKYHK